MKHERTEMKYIRNIRKISRPTLHFRNGKGIWLNIYECPVCGAQKSPPQNSAKKSYYCEGVK